MKNLKRQLVCVVVLGVSLGCTIQRSSDSDESRGSRDNTSQADASQAEAEADDEERDESPAAHSDAGPADDSGGASVAPEVLDASVAPEVLDAAVPGTSSGDNPLLQPDASFVEWGPDGAVPEDLDEQLDQLAEDFSRLTLDEQESLVADLDAKLERRLLTLSGIEEELGGAEATDQIWLDALAGLNAQLEPVTAQELVFEPAQAPSAPSLGAAFFGGYLVSVLATSGALDATKDGSAGRSEPADTIQVEGALDKVSITADVTHTSDGLTTKLQTRTTVSACPDADGALKGSVHLGMSASVQNGAIGSNGTLDIEFTATFDDDASLAALEISSRFQLARFGNQQGQFIDVTQAFGVKGDIPARSELNRGAHADAAFAKEASSLNILFSVMIVTQLESAVEQSIEAGRCVALEATSDGTERTLVEPSTPFSILAAPRSRLDGTPTGGTVVGRLNGGSGSLQPLDEKVPADASFSYTAPSGFGETGTVKLVSRSKRGVGKAELEFSTKEGQAPQAYTLRAHVTRRQAEGDSVDSDYQLEASVNLDNFEEGSISNAEYSSTMVTISGSEKRTYQGEGGDANCTVDSLVAESGHANLAIGIYPDVNVFFGTLFVIANGWEECDTDLEPEDGSRPGKEVQVEVDVDIPWRDCEPLAPNVEITLMSGGVVVPISVPGVGSSTLASASSSESGTCPDGKVSIDFSASAE